MAQMHWLCTVLIGAVVDIIAGPPYSQGQVSAGAHQSAAQPAVTRERRQRAEAGEPEAQYQLAVNYSQGVTAQDYAEAVKWFRKAAEQGHSQAQVSVGEFYREGLGGLDKDPRQAVAWFRKAADQGDAFGQAELALMYETGAGVPQDEAEAVRWYTRAADQGLPVAQFDLAYMYENGKGVTTDCEKAVRLYELAALSVPTARQNLAVFYAEGSGPVRKEPIIAYKWAMLAVSAEVQRMLHQREVDSEPRLGHAIILAEHIAKSMNKSQKKAARKLAQDWINSNASHLSEEPQTFATTTKLLK